MSQLRSNERHSRESTFRFGAVIDGSRDFRAEHVAAVLVLVQQRVAVIVVDFRSFNALLSIGFGAVMKYKRLTGNRAEANSQEMARKLSCGRRLQSHLRQRKKIKTNNDM